MEIPTNDPAVGNMKTGKDAEGSPIRMCDEHHMEIATALDASGTSYSKTEEELAAKVQKREPDALFEVTRVIMTVALKVMGSVELIKLRCPMCALRRFDFIGHTVEIVAEKMRKMNARIIAPPEKHVELIRPVSMRNRPN